MQIAHQACFEQKKAWIYLNGGSLICTWMTLADWHFLKWVGRVWLFSIELFLRQSFKESSMINFKRWWYTSSLSAAAALLSLSCSGLEAKGHVLTYFLLFLQNILQSCGHVKKRLLPAQEMLGNISLIASTQSCVHNFLCICPWK